MNLLSAEMVYDDWADAYDRDTLTRIQWTAPDYVFNRLRGVCMPQTRLFELGVGTGQLAQKFAEVCQSDLWGVDVSQKMLDRLISKAGLNGRQMHKLDAEHNTLPHPDGFFDGTYSCGVIEYFENPQLALGETVRITRPKGMIIHCFETAHGIVDQRTCIARGSKGLSADGAVQFGSFFYYHHPDVWVAAQLRDAGCAIHETYLFNSTPHRQDFDPVTYAIVVAEKLTADGY